MYHSSCQDPAELECTTLAWEAKRVPDSPALGIFTSIPHLCPLGGGVDLDLTSSVEPCQLMVAFHRLAGPALYLVPGLGPGTARVLLSQPMSHAHDAALALQVHA